MPVRITPEEFFAQLDDLGEDEVRLRYKTRKFGEVGDKKALVEEWIRRKDQARQDAKDADNLATARSASEAASRAARAAESQALTARRALKIAIAAAIMAAAAIIIDIVAFL